MVTALVFLVSGDALIRIYFMGRKRRGDNIYTDVWKAISLYYAAWSAALYVRAGIFQYSERMRRNSSAYEAGVTAVCVNLVFNYLLIYGKFGFPELGVQGAAIATVLSRYVEVLIILIWTSRNTEKLPFIKGLYRTLMVPRNLVWKIFVKGTPLLLNEALWACGVAVLAQCYSIRGLNVVAAQNISNTISNVFNIVFIALGDSVAIVVGQLLGAGDMKRQETQTINDCFFYILLYGSGSDTSYNGACFP